MASDSPEGCKQDDLSALVDALEPLLLDRLSAKLMQRLGDKEWKNNLFVPSTDVYTSSPDSPFMQHSTCSSRDFFHPAFKRLYGLLNFSPFFFHRKYWEWVFILHHISKHCRLAGQRGLGFGVGATEPLAAVFAKFGAFVTATDAPPEIGTGGGWTIDRSFANRVDDLPHEGIVDKDAFRRLVVFRECDMNAIAEDLTDYDFCWSSCCLEHLGNLHLGIEFIINSVEKTLKVGGIACHTTEFNLSSNDETVSEGATVLYRHRDIVQLIDRLRARGHLVDDLRVAPDSFVMDGYVDTPPFGPPLHLKLSLLGFTSTSLGLVIRRGR